MGTTFPDKSVESRLDYTFDWNGAPPGPFLGGGETIISSEWTVANNDGSLSVDSNSYTSTTTTIWLSRGTAGKTYTLRNKITTNSTPARVAVRTATIKIADSVPI